MSDFTIASFDELEPAEALAHRMSSEGFEAATSNDSAEQLLKFYNAHPRANCHVMVAGDEIEEALQWLKELDSLEPRFLSSAIRCPECTSTQVEFPQFSRKTIVGSLPAIAAAAGIIDREFYCRACQFTWAPDLDPVDIVPPHKDQVRKPHIL